MLFFHIETLSDLDVLVNSLFYPFLIYPHTLHNNYYNTINWQFHTCVATPFAGLQVEVVVMAD